MVHSRARTSSKTTERRLSCAIWESTLACNLRCTHCGSSAGTPRANELTTTEAFSLCEQLAELGCKDLAIMGGEPFMRPDWPSVARCARQLGMTVSFVSNGTAVPSLVDDLERIEPRVVGISLDGMRGAHESIRGAGTWEKAVGAVEVLRSRGIQTTVITTVSKNNFRDLPAMRDLIRGKGVNWQIQTAMPFGNFKREQMLSKEEFYATALFIAKERIRNKFEDLPVVGAHCYGYFSKLLPGCRWNGCQAGISSIGVTSDGNIVGCLSMGNDRFLEGNIRDRRLRDIWNDPRSFGYNRSSEGMLPGENCKDCRHLSDCGGGCSSVSYALTEKFHNNPYCFYAIENELGVK
jgi:radical SAM protein with 4Fe4S-binding SPASM domain